MWELSANKGTCDLSRFIVVVVVVLPLAPSHLARLLPTATLGPKQNFHIGNSCTMQHAKAKQQSNIFHGYIIVMHASSKGELKIYPSLATIP